MPASKYDKLRDLARDMQALAAKRNLVLTTATQPRPRRTTYVQPGPPPGGILCIDYLDMLRVGK